MSLFSRDFYAVLEVPRNAHSDDIRKAFLRKAKVLHPDKNARGDGERFEELSVAYHTLNDPQLRALYDSTVARDGTPQEDYLQIEGNELFKSFEQAAKYSKHTQILDLLPRLEKQYGTTIKFKEGVPCKGNHECGKWNYLGYLLPDRPRLLMCQKHMALHVCDETCTTDDVKCHIYAQFLAQQWLDHLDNVWEVHVSEHQSKGLRYYFNTKTGAALWEMPPEPCIIINDTDQDGKPVQHHCNSEDCGGAFIKLGDGIWMCSNSGKPHICTFIQCKFTERTNVGKYVCWATHNEYGYDASEDLAEDQKTVVQSNVLLKEQGLDNLSSRKRRISYVNKAGKKVEELIDVPWGFDIGEEVKNETMGKKFYLKYQTEKDEREEEMKRMKTMNHSRKQKKNKGHEQEEQEFYNSEDDIYDNEEGESFYHQYIAPALDYRDHFKEEEGDYTTMKIKAGGIEGAAEEEEEKEELGQEVDQQQSSLLVEYAVETKKQKRIEYHRQQKENIKVETEDKSAK